MKITALLLCLVAAAGMYVLAVTTSGDMNVAQAVASLFVPAALLIVILLALGIRKAVVSGWRATRRVSTETVGATAGELARAARSVNTESVGAAAGELVRAAASQRDRFADAYRKARDRK